MIVPSLVLGYFRRGEMSAVKGFCLPPCDFAEAELTTGEVIDLVLLLAFLLAWLMLHAWVHRRYRSLQRHSAWQMENHASDAVQGEEGQAREEDNSSSVTRRATAYRHEVTRSPSTRDSKKNVVKMGSPTVLGAAHPLPRHV